MGITSDTGAVGEAQVQAASRPYFEGMGLAVRTSTSRSGIISRLGRSDTNDLTIGAG